MELNSNPAPAKPASGIFSDIEALRLDPADFAVASAEIMATVPVRKPKRDEFFRINPDPLMSMTTSVYIDKDDGDTCYLIAPGMRSALAGEFRTVALYIFVTPRGVMGVWPVPVPTDTREAGSGWIESRRVAVQNGKTSWVRVLADMSLGAYRILKAMGDLGEPQFPDIPFNEILEIAFRGKVIDSEDHPIVRRLRGL